MGFRLPTHRGAAAGVLTLQCWYDRPYCASAQLNHLSNLWPERQKDEAQVHQFGKTMLDGIFMVIYREREEDDQRLAHCRFRRIE